MEVFISYKPEDNMMLLSETATAWAECAGDENVKIIQVDDKLHKSEMMRRIVADNLADSEFYILADLGCIPDAPDMVRSIVRKLAKEKKEPGDLIGLWPADMPAGEFPEGVRICRKGAVKHWVPKRTVTYDEEHAESVRHSRGKVEIWQDTTFKHVRAS